MKRDTTDGIKDVNSSRLQCLYNGIVFLVLTRSKIHEYLSVSYVQYAEITVRYQSRDNYFNIRTNKVRD
jgi:hypothetical protein